MNIQEIYNAAYKAGACTEKGLKMISRANNVNDLIDLMKSPQGIEFCMKNQFPSLDLLNEYREQLESNNIYPKGTDKTIINPRFVIVFGGSITVQVDDFNVCEIYATNDSKVIVKASDNAYVSIELHHDSIAETTKSGKSNILLINKTLVKK
ncbi:MULTISPECIES: hypothetical protein [Sphingobacterium]|uniref:Uncharacterized protein n=1 Tax=Sphingobacterium tenebrionis TaxID=3111775 RepID=A0ABU8I4T7_9SPHI|nr:hypothetical protein [Sphingobacterium sp. CZ-2]QBR11481.1 hypothetical protein E3D81_04545 [Sphingobacterium sp. CZ-2]